jgi:uncharacterized protein (TIGR03435 family)
MNETRIHSTRRETTERLAPGGRLRAALRAQERARGFRHGWWESPADMARKWGFACPADRPVPDQTGLTGRFDFDLTWAGDPTLSGGRGGPPAEPSHTPALFIAVQKQPGLRLVAPNASAEILVIDHVGRPSGN